MLTNQQIEKICPRIVDKLFGSHHMVIFLTVKPISNFWEKEGSNVDQSTNLKLESFPEAQNWSIKGSYKQEGFIVT